MRLASAALWLRGEPIPVGDVDVVIEPGEQNLRRLRAALTDLAVRPRMIPRVAALGELPVVTVATSYGRVDCLLERGRLGWERLRRTADVIPVAEVNVLVVSAADAWALRRPYTE